MKKLRIVCLSILILSCLTIFAGCWDYREINELATVSGVAIDKGKDGNKYYLTVEIVDLRGTGKETKIQSKIVQSEGKTFLDGVRNIIKISAKRLYWGHADIVIISQEVAKEGILPIIDVYLRVRETRLSSHILISKEKTARELLSQESITTNVRSVEMREMINNERKFLGKSPHVNVRDFINMLSEEGQYPVLAAVGTVLNEGSQTSELSGMAVFKGDKFGGFLNEEDTKFFLFIKNRIKDTMFSLNENSSDGYKDVALEIGSSKTKVKPAYSNGKLSMNLDIKAEASLNELGISNHFFDEKGLETLQREAERTLKFNVENVIRKVKKEYGLDIFGFGTTIKREMPSLWKRIASDWDKMFLDLEVNVNVDIEIKSSGISSKPIDVRDNK